VAGERLREEVLRHPHRLIPQPGEAPEEVAKTLTSTGKNA
jgi:hypothetical protein